MKTRFVALALVVALLGMFTIAPLTASAAPPATNAVTIPIDGAFAGGTFDGVFNLTRFAVQGGVLKAIGTLTGTLTNTATGVVTNVTNFPLALPVDLLQTTGSCEILDLVLGPLTLDLLGLVVTLNQVELNITAESGPGNLLGNLLCAVANLLNTGGPLQGLAGLLNRILGILG